MAFTQATMQHTFTYLKILQKFQSNRIAAQFVAMCKWPLTKKKRSVTSGDNVIKLFSFVTDDEAQ